MIELVVPIILLVVGIILLTFSSNKTVDHSVILACNWSVPPIIIGLVLVSIGTDFPEIMNSVLASSLGHGNINVGTSIGSTFAQLTLVLGVIALAVKQFKVNKKEVFAISISTMLVLILSFLLINDGNISRFDGLFLIISWVFIVLILRRIARKDFSCPPRRAIGIRRSSYHVMIIILGFAGVAVGTYLIINSILEITQIFNISELIASFFIASIGTSLPELTVTLTAIRKGQQELALGDVMGSSLLDASISIGIGPLLFPTAINGGPAVAIWIYTIFAVFIVSLVLTLMGKVDKKVGFICLGLYLFSYSLQFFS